MALHMGIALKAAETRYPGAKTFTFGDGRELCDRLLRLVREGTKQATCGALRDFERDGESMPTVGSREIALDWDGLPILVIETTEVCIQRFCDVQAAFALAEGENDTLEGWQEDHRRFFERNGGWSAEMELVCERFRLIEVFD